MAHSPFPTPILYYLRHHVDTDALLAASPLTGPIGFDIEYPPTFLRGQPRNKTALIQLASDHAVLLVQVSAMSTFPSSIKAILENPQIIKAGVGIQADADKLRHDFGINPASCLELSLLARAVDPRWSIEPRHNFIGLARLVETYQDRVMQKSKRIQLSDWSRFLSEEQQDYAADDALASLDVFHTLFCLLAKLKSPPDASPF